MFLKIYNIYDQSNSCTQLFGISITLLQLLISLLSFFIHPEASIGVLEKKIYEFLEHPYISMSEKCFNKMFWGNSILKSLIQVHL